MRKVLTALCIVASVALCIILFCQIRESRRAPQIGLIVFPDIEPGTTTKARIQPGSIDTIDLGTRDLPDSLPDSLRMED